MVKMGSKESYPFCRFKLNPSKLAQGIMHYYFPSLLRIVEIAMHASPIPNSRMASFVANISNTESTTTAIPMESATIFNIVASGAVAGFSVG